jgi:hypothetical protein
LIRLDLPALRLPKMAIWNLLPLGVSLKLPAVKATPAPFLPKNIYLKNWSITPKVLFLAVFN